MHLSFRLKYTHPGALQKQWRSHQRMLVNFLFFLFDQFLLWVLERALLHLQAIFDIRQAMLLGFLNAVVGVALFHFLDRLKSRM